jgi:hypothetical protein
MASETEKRLSSLESAIAQLGMSLNNQAVVLKKVIVRLDKYAKEKSDQQVHDQVPVRPDDTGNENHTGL